MLFRAIKGNVYSPKRPALKTSVYISWLESLGYSDDGTCPYLVVSSNFVPGTTATTIESAMQLSGETHSSRSRPSRSLLYVARYIERRDPKIFCESGSATGLTTGHLVGLECNLRQIGMRKTRNRAGLKL